MLSKFFRKSAQKMLIFSNKANFERGLFIWTLFASVCVQAEENNSVIMTDNGLEMFHWDLDFIRSAQESIEALPAFFGGEIARQLLTTIENRLEQVPGLKAYILTTPTLLEEEDWKIIERMLSRFPTRFFIEHASTITLIWPDVIGVDNHIKMMVVDEKYFSMGGTNLDETQVSEGTWTPQKNNNKISVISDNLPAGARDQDVVGSGPLATHLRQIFFKVYALWEHYNKTGFLEKDPETFKDKTRYYAVTSQGHVERFARANNKRTIKPSQAKIFLSGPHQKCNEITQEYERLLQEAKEEIIISNLYFCPVASIFNALLEAVNRGVKLTVLTNGINDVSAQYTKFFCWANRSNYVPVLYGDTFHFWDAWSLADQPLKNTRIYEYHVKDILLHKKIMIIDGKKSIVGSYNLGTRSDMGDYEIILSIDSPEVAADMKRIHEKDLKYSREISDAEARRWYFDPVYAFLGEAQKRFHGLL